MPSRLSARSLTVALAVALALASLSSPSVAHAQGVAVTMSAGIATLVRPSSSLLQPGPALSLAVSRAAAGPRLELGLEASYTHFGAKAGAYFPPVLIGGDGIVTTPATKLDVGSLFATGRYLFGGSALRPYVAAGAGIVQRLSGQVQGDPVAGEKTNLGARAAAGVETRLGARVGAALEVGYVSVGGLRYGGDPLRYVPVTLRLSF